jgi:hypothetical protein
VRREKAEACPFLFEKFLNRRSSDSLPLVMPGLVPGINVFVSIDGKRDMDGRVKPGHDE